MDISQIPQRTLAICGVGRMGQIRADCIEHCPGFKITYVVDPIGIQLRDSIAAKHGAGVAAKLSEVIHKVDAVVLCTPTIFHAEDVMLCIENNKPVFAEKPLAFTKKETFDLYEAANNKKVPVFTAYNRRAAIPFYSIKKQCSPEEIHRISFVFRDNPMPPVELLKTLGDIYEDVSCHNLDLALWYLQEKPIRVFAKSFASFNEHSVVDCAAAILEFSNQRAVICDWSRKSTTNYDERVEIFAKDRTIIANIQKPDGKNGYSFREAYWDAYSSEIVQFKSIVEDFYGKKPYNIERPYEYCLWVVDIVNALQRSAISGKEEYVYPSSPISLDIVGRGHFSQYVQKEVLKSHLWDFYNLKQVFHTQNPYKNEGATQAVYVCTSPVNISKVAIQALEEKKHVLVEKLAFTNVKDYQHILQKARQNNVKLSINFSRRFEPQNIEIKKLLEKHTGDVTLHIDTGSIANDKSQDGKLNHYLDSIDLAVYFAWPFVSAHYVRPESEHSGLIYIFSKADGSGVTAIINHTPNASSNSSKITFNNHVFHKQDKELETQRLHGLKESFISFYKSIQFNQTTENDASNTPFYWTYVLFEAAPLH
jgi:myo-inositol 2-dehydrogenase/D-chiro-inositol 1-dehydrogenase